MHCTMFPSTGLVGEFSTFTFVREIATGGQGTVFVARLPSGEEVAIKAIRLQLEVTEEERQSRISHLEEAMKTVKALNHPNIVRHFHTAYYNVAPSVTDTPRFYITMELCKGSLSREARKRPINGFYLQKWAKEMLNGLAYLHASRIVHRDLKADNVFLTSDDPASCTLKIGDLGDIKHLMDSFQPVSESRGTYAHMSPEMIRGTISSHHAVFQKTDIWSFGCILIEMLTGELPQFINRQTPTGVPLLYKGRGCEMPIMFFVGKGGRPEIQEQWPEAMKAVIQQCLEAEPDHRPTAAKLLESVLIKGAPPVWNRGGLTTSISVEGLHMSPCPSIQMLSDAEKLSQFSVVKAIAFGSYGMVYHVKMKDGEDRAMKMVPLDPVDKDLKDNVKAVQKVMKTMTALTHRNIVSHFYSGIMDSSPLSTSRHFYISMELCHGGILSHTLRRIDPIDGSTLRRWTRDVLSGLAFLHEKHIVHRTLNAYNVLLSSESLDTCVLKIAGLCDCKPLLGSITGPQEVAVIQRFLMSPEMINGSVSPEFNIGRKTDIWNFGLLLIEMLTGRVPRFVYRTLDGKTEHQCATSQEIMFFVGCGGRPQIEGTWPRGWRDMISRCTQINPVTRPTAMDLLKNLSGAGDRRFDGLLRRSSSSNECLIS
ncbi:putative Mitogen-activated protein kinase kinase kinase 12 [Hypsibius exemplaris]|uniref:Mitogen-activated protein kinase kinase kinase 12 n=1 Tax=Hypsibius exemplaris TaxID=2072580 RepID=A0A1W0W913_HYPEX|nr:putative Mitogen-activated protein kinase kinase kinase 12 [Hypsibius exemplaris]